MKMREPKHKQFKSCGGFTFFLHSPPQKNDVPSTTVRREGAKEVRTPKMGEEYGRERRGRRTVVVEESAGFSLVDEGLYRAELIDIQDIETQFGVSWRWVFDLVDFPEETLVSGVSSQKMTTRSKAYEWVSVLLGREPEPGEEVSFDDLIGKQAMVTIKNRAMRDGREISNVVALAKMPKQMSIGKVDERAEAEAEKEIEEEAEEETEEEAEAETEKKQQKKAKKTRRNK